MYDISETKLVPPILSHWLLTEHCVLFNIKGLVNNPCSALVQIQDGRIWSRGHLMLTSPHLTEGHGMNES